LIARFIGWEDFDGDTVLCMVRTSCVTPLKPLAIALWLMLTEQAKQMVELNRIRLAFVLERLRTFQRWITRASDDQL
jgi:hypothetical protein